MILLMNFKEKDHGQDIIGNSAGSYNALMIAIIIQEAVEQDIFKGFAFDAPVSSLCDRFYGVIARIAV